MSATREDKVYYEGWHDGYKHAIDDIRQELLTLEADTETYVSLEIYETLNHMKRRIENGKN
ncbi:MAG: hypothetical protein U0L97_02375 [Candidatus Saccharimonadaceae bacterium]|nr:hypothetical protein [Candidatus Saccharimonadaceae bacterium]